MRSALYLATGVDLTAIDGIDEMHALTLISDSQQRNIPVGVLTELTRADFYFWGPLMAGALLGSIPIALLYSFFVDHYAAGLTAGAVKG